MPGKFLTSTFLWTTFSYGAAWECSVGHKAKTDLADISCSGEYGDCTENLCCEFDLSTCFGIAEAGQVGTAAQACSASKYADKNKIGNAHGDNFDTNCCSPRATCSEGMAANASLCPTGYKLKDDALCAHAL